ncbi:malate synthase G [Thalassotalea ganghwensis]
MQEYTDLGAIKVANCLYQFVEDEVLAELPIDSHAFWQGSAEIIKTLTPLNQQLLAKRKQLQDQLDDWYNTHQYSATKLTEYKTFLRSIGYLEPVVDDFTITTNHVDKELSTMAGPQLVVPIMNARFALNAVNARWGSLYDAIYGSDIISENGGAEKGRHYNPARGAKVIEKVKDYLDQFIPLSSGSHKEATYYDISSGQLQVTLANGSTSKLQDPKSCVGYTGSKALPKSLLFKHNQLHVELCFEKEHVIGQSDLANISDVIIESALTTIMDCEDSVAAVDASDKVIAYRNWLGLNKGILTEQIEKNDQQFVRAMANDRTFTTLSDQEFTLPGRSVMFVRNVGHLMTNDMVTLADGQWAPEGIVDAIMTSLIAMYDLLKKGPLSNSKTGSIYIVKPKMHGSEEVAFATTLFSKVETLLALPKNTIKIGIMDEERRTSINLKNCIHAAKERVVFINTGFLDRTGDEIHTSMKAGVMVKKAEIKETPWISAYENNNVDIGLACGFSGRAQIGKGMWPIPDKMAEMLESKKAHVLSGANTAWVPSPTAATLHALHYHMVNVAEQQQQLKLREPAQLDQLLTLPLATTPSWSAEEVQKELMNNAQGILGYVVRWIDQGVGCSKVPDINDIGLMEDRATLRISSQHIANWLYHNVCSEKQVIEVLKQMAKVVDEQNAHDTHYHAMSPNFDQSIAFQAACALVFQGIEQPNGYTEPLLHYYRLKLKEQHQ